MRLRENLEGHSAYWTTSWRHKATDNGKTGPSLDRLGAISADDLLHKLHCKRSSKSASKENRQVPISPVDSGVLNMTEIFSRDKLRQNSSSVRPTNIIPLKVPAGKRQGSCLPLLSKQVSPVDLFYVCCDARCPFGLGCTD